MGAPTLVQLLGDLASPRDNSRNSPRSLQMNRGQVTLAGPHTIGEHV
jgi:hypothetical protein